MARSQVPSVVFQPTVRTGLQDGIAAIVNAIRPTLGPVPRVTAIDRVVGDGTPEVLDSGAVIARRLLGLADRDADTGAMVLRQAPFLLHQAVGDACRCCERRSAN
jgi:hypothetical protein